MAKPFQKGHDPRRNAGGRPKSVAEVVELCRKHTPAVVARLAEIALTGDERAAVAAAKELLDRGYGKPTQLVDITHDRTELERRAREILARRASEAGQAEKTH